MMMKGKMEFPFFLNSVKNKTCYLKSASYLMQSEEFKIVRKLFLEQFDYILQDESGFAYGRLIKDYDVNLFGTYTRPLKVFKIFKQEDLKDALEGSTPLPFKIGYASQLNESVLMSCSRKDPNAPKADVLIEQATLTEDLVSVMGVLNEREKTVISSYFGVNAERQTMAEIGQTMGLKRERIRQVRDQALRKLHRAAKKEMEQE